MITIITKHYTLSRFIHGAKRKCILNDSVRPRFANGSVHRSSVGSLVGSTRKAGSRSDVEKKGATLTRNQTLAHHVTELSQNSVIIKTEGFCALLLH
jgi:hypothetical protein